GVFRVVVGELVFHVLRHAFGGSHGRQDIGVGDHPPAADQGDEQRPRARTDPPPAQPVQGSGKGTGEESDEVAPGRGVRTRYRLVCQCHLWGQSTDECGFLTRGTYHCQVGGDPLVEIDHLVDLLSREGTSTAYQVIEPFPLLVVCRREHVDIHAGDPTGSPAGTMRARWRGNVEGRGLPTEGRVHRCPRPEAVGPVMTSTGPPRSSQGTRSSSIYGRPVSPRGQRHWSSTSCCSSSCCLRYRLW